LRADAGHVRDLIENLSLHNSTPGDGITRPSFSREFVDVNKQVIEIMKGLGMDVYMDQVGNLTGRLEGSDPSLPALCVGSHLDTVRNGGKYDGAAGIVCGLELVRLLRGRGVVLKHPIQVMAFVEEEGTALQSGLLGSRWFNGEAAKEDLLGLQFENNRSAVKVIEEFRNSFPEVPECKDGRIKNIRAFFEVHIEQGPVLETEGMDLGIVNAIAGTSTIEVSVKGRADHAGSTPMDLRTDAFEVAAHAAVEMYRYARSFPHAVATVGRIEIPNGSSNRVPDRTWFTLDLRSADAETMDGLIPHAKEVLLKMAEQNGSSVEVSISHFVPPIELDPELRNILNEKAHVLSDRVMEINSGAAHDSLVMAKYSPTAMLFVPSRGGRSHCPEESSRAEDLALAVDVLADALAEMDRNI
jgi:allantoate deiminase